MKHNDNRVLGRILAVEETSVISGAKNTTACYDYGYITYSNTDTNATYDCLTGISTDTGPEIDTSPITDRIKSLSSIKS